MIKRLRKGLWVLYTADGSRELGRHGTEVKAEAQERAIQISKHRKAKADMVKSRIESKNRAVS